MSDNTIGPNEFPFYENEPEAPAEEAEKSVAQGPGSAFNADQVDGYQVSPASAPSPNTIVPIGNDGLLPSSIIPGVSGRVLQVVTSSSGALLQGTLAMPYDDTIPQNTEGNEILTASITPSSASNILLIFVNIIMSHTTGDYNVAAIFQDSTANALAAGALYLSGNWVGNLNISHKMTAGTTSSTTFKLRVGPSSTGRTDVNGAAGARYLGGVSNTVLQVVEISV